MFSGGQTHRGKSQSPVAWVAWVEETKPMKPTDKAILGMVSESPDLPPMRRQRHLQGVGDHEYVHDNWPRQDQQRSQLLRHD